MWFFRDIVFPIVLALLALTLIVFILNLVLRFFHLDIPILRFSTVGSGEKEKLAETLNAVGQL